MKMLNLILVAMISLILSSCSNKELMEPNSETEIPNNTGSAAFDAGLKQPGGFGRRLLGGLDLTDAQKNRIKEILESHKEKMSSIRGTLEDGPSREEMQAKRKEFHEAIKAGIYDVLTPEQQTLFLERLEKGKKHFGDRAHRFGSEHAKRRIGHLISALDLNETQQDQLKEIFEKVGSDMKAQSNGRDGKNREEIRHTRREKMQKTDTQIKAILNAEQLQKYEELKAQRKERMSKHFE